jgi:outer membrane protein assembly factor BamB
VRDAGHLLCICVAAIAVGNASSAEPNWTTYRGNPQRTGNTDGLAGPKAPHVLWVHPSREHFIAGPVPAGEQVLFAGLGGFNVPQLYAVASNPKATQRIAWSQSTPLLKLPLVGSPAVQGDRLFFGDGMHQTDGAFMHCLSLKGGLPLWQFPLPGKLVHLEGSPTLANGRLYLGGGAAGVLCIDPERVTLDGQEKDLAAIQKQLADRWKELHAAYEADRKKDPDFAVPPNLDQLPKPMPRLVWQQGQDKWHVDAAVAVVGDRVLAASAFLDKEGVGDRALFCLDASTGAVRWRAPLRLNPWAGPSVLGDLVVIGGSSIGYDPRALKGAKGEVVAFQLADGTEKWRKEVPAGGVLSAVALVEGLAVAAATDGKLRAFDLATGQRRWVYDCKAPLFAAPAVAAGVVYVGDLRGSLHAVRLTTGELLWNLDLATHPQVKAPGMIYGGPVIHAGRLFVATCNLAEGPLPNQPTVMVCLGDP